MPVQTKIKTNASQEEIEEAIDGYNSDVTSLGKGVFDIYMASYDRYHLSCESANDCLEDNLKYEFNKAGKKLQFKIIETELI